MRAAALALGLLALSAVPALDAPAPLDLGVRLEWRFIADKPFYQHMVTETTQKMKVQGTDISSTQKQTFLIRWSPVKQLPDRSWVVKYKVEAMKAEIDMAGNKLTFDSAKPDPKNPLTQLFAVFVGTELTLTLNKRKELTKVQGREALLARLAKVEPNLRAILEHALSEGALKALADPLFATL